MSFFAGRTGHPLLEKIVDAIYRRHLCRVAPYPPVLDESMATMALPVYDTLWALNEFACTTEEPDCYFAVLRGFLAQVGGGNAAGVSLEPTVTATAG